jgi:hypothetical protein
MTREHLVSRSVIGDGVVAVKGLPMAPSLVLPLPASRLSRKILCRKHNNDLGPLDAEAGRAVAALSGAGEAGGIDRKGIDGFKLERWCLKTCINAWYHRVDRSPGLPWRPPADWIEIAFGRRCFQGYGGLYLAPETPTSPVPGHTLFEVEARFPHGEMNPIGAVLRIGQRFFTLVIDGRYELRDQVFRPRIVPFGRPVQGAAMLHWEHKGV